MNVLRIDAGIAVCIGVLPCVFGGVEQFQLVAERIRAVGAQAGNLIRIVGKAGGRDGLGRVEEVAVADKTIGWRPLPGAIQYLEPDLVLVAEDVFEPSIYG